MTEESRDGLTYAQAGLDIEASNRMVDLIKPLVRATARAGADPEIGGFDGLFDLKRAGCRDPVLVAATDGVGTKVKIAIETGRHDTIGIDLVAMSVNDLVVQGAEPLFFLDYFACGKLAPEVGVAVVTGVAAGCRAAGCALIGGETAEMPGPYLTGDYDLAGFAVGAAERGNLLPRRDIKAGDAVPGLASCLAAHITGGGLPDNIARVLPQGLGVELDLARGGVATTGGIAEPEMLRTFNCGIGMVVIMEPAAADAVTGLLERYGEQVVPFGQMVEQPAAGVVTYRGQLALTG